MPAFFPAGTDGRKYLANPRRLQYNLKVMARCPAGYDCRAGAFSPPACGISKTASPRKGGTPYREAVSAGTETVDEDGSYRKIRRMLPRPGQVVRESVKSRINTATEVLPLPRTRHKRLKPKE